MIPGDGFGPAIILASLIQEGVAFHTVGFVSAYANELRLAGSAGTTPATGRAPETHAENMERLLLALRRLDARVDDGAGGWHSPEVTGDLADGEHAVDTALGRVLVTVRTPSLGLGLAGSVADGVRICIPASLPDLRAYLAKGAYPGLADVIDVVELFDGLGTPQGSDE